LRQQLIDLPDNKLAEHLMRFGSSLRGTRAYWTKCRTELTDMITQLGCPTLFFTLSAADTKWPDLHNVMPKNAHSHRLNEHRIKIENVIQYPHIVAMFMHHRFEYLSRRSHPKNILKLKTFGTGLFCFSLLLISIFFFLFIVLFFYIYYYYIYTFF
jgi:hypothetical protein